MENEKQTAVTKANKNISNSPYSTQTFNIFVGGLPATCTPPMLNNYFSQFGKILKSEPQTWNKKSTSCRGFAIIRCADKSTFDKILGHSKHRFQDRVIWCKEHFKTKEKLKSHFNEVTKRKIFVRGLSSRISTDDLESFFSRYGELEIAYVVKHKKTGKSKGFGYICFKDTRVTEKILSIGEFSINGKTVNCYRYNMEKRDEIFKKIDERSSSRVDFENGAEFSQCLDHLNPDKESPKNELDSLLDEDFKQSENEICSTEKGESNQTFLQKDYRYISLAGKSRLVKDASQMPQLPYLSNEGHTNVIKEEVFKRKMRPYSLFGKFKSRRLWRKFNQAKKVDKNKKED